MLKITKTRLKSLRPTKPPMRKLVMSRGSWQGHEVRRHQKLQPRVAGFCLRRTSCPYVTGQSTYWPRLVTLVQSGKMRPWPVSE